MEQAVFLLECLVLIVTLEASNHKGQASHLVLPITILEWDRNISYTLTHELAPWSLYLN